LAHEEPRRTLGVGALEHDDRLSAELLDRRPAADRELEPPEAAAGAVRVRHRHDAERLTGGVDEEGRAPVRADLLPRGRVDPREELRRLEGRAERAGDVQERAGGAGLAGEVLAALLEPLRERRERVVLTGELGAVEEALLREQEEEEGRTERIEAPQRREREP